jgi:hypothetical protein
MAKNYSLTWDPAAGAFPLSPHSGGRYVVDTGGRPWCIQAEFHWQFLFQTDADVDTYLANRKAKGFNAIVCSAPNTSAPVNTSDGQAPFTTSSPTYYLDTPNAAFFARVKALIDRAAAQGFAILFFYTYAGYAGHQWYDVVADAHNTQAVCYNYGLFLGALLKQCPNVVLMSGGDFTMPSGETRTRMHKILEGIKAAGCYWMAGSEWGDPDTIATDQAGYICGLDRASDQQLHSFYGEGPAYNGRTYLAADRAYTSATTLPTYVQEAYQFEGTYVAGFDGSREGCRKRAFWARLAGGNAGENSGQVDLANSADLGKLENSCALDTAKRFALFGSLSWHLHKPSGTASVSAHGPSGSAAYCGRLLITTTNTQNDSLIAASMASDGSSLLAYVPPTGIGVTTFSVDLRSMSAGTKTARWFNPTTGGYSNASPSTVDNTPSAQSFTTPGNNGTGTNDWVLVIG